MKISSLSCGFSCMCSHRVSSHGASPICSGPSLLLSCHLPPAVDIRAVEHQTGRCDCRREPEGYPEHLRLRLAFQQCAGMRSAVRFARDSFGLRLRWLFRSQMRGPGAGMTTIRRSTLRFPFILADFLPVDRSCPGALLQLLMKFFIASGSIASRWHCPCLCHRFGSFSIGVLAGCRGCHFGGRPQRLSFAS